MAVKQHSNGILNTLLEQFQIPPAKYALQAINQGFINDTFLVSREGVPYYVLQRINHSVFPNVTGLMDNIDKAFKLLESNSYRSIKLVPNLEGGTFVNHKTHGYWRLMSYIDSSLAYDTTKSASIALEAGRIIGTFHLLLDSANPEDYVDTIPHFHDLNFRSDQFRKALETATAEKLQIAEEAIYSAKETLEKLTILNSVALPLRICHNDTKLNNILFSKKTKKALCLIDLDTLMKGYFHYDFGDAVRTIANTAPEDEQNHTNITFDRDLFKAFVDGLALNGPFLTEKEIETLPLGVVLMPFLHGIRALTDYLNDNIYYKVAYENQNLDRCLSLFDFTAKAIKSLKWMKDCVLRKLTPIDS